MLPSSFLLSLSLCTQDRLYIPWIFQWYRYFPRTWHFSKLSSTSSLHCESFRNNNCFLKVWSQANEAWLATDLYLRPPVLSHLDKPASPLSSTLSKSLWALRLVQGVTHSSSTGCYLAADWSFCPGWTLATTSSERKCTGIPFLCQFLHNHWDHSYHQEFQDIFDVVETNWQVKNILGECRWKQG